MAREKERLPVMETDVFQRKRTKNQPAGLIHPILYNALIGAILLWGFAMNWFLVTTISTRWITDINVFFFTLFYFASCFTGIFLFVSYDNPWISFLGFNLVVLPFGLLLNVFVSLFDTTIVAEAFRVTAIVTLVMMVLGSFFYGFFQKIYLALGISLFTVILVEVVEMTVFKVNHDIFDWLFALIFCGYIGYDWGRANRIPRTVDNAVDSAAALYMDIVNLFLRLLRLFGRKSKK